jgi:hypothetical protein
MDNIFLSYNLVEHYVSPIFGEQKNQSSCKMSRYIIRGLKSRKPAKEG